MSCGFRVKNTDPADLRPGKGGNWRAKAPESTPTFLCGLLLAKPTWRHEDRNLVAAAHRQGQGGGGVPAQSSGFSHLKGVI